MSEESAQTHGQEEPPPERAHIEPWWRRSPPKAAAAALAIGAGTWWFGDMLHRVPLDRHSTLGFLLMLPLLLIVPAFSAAALRLAWHAFRNSTKSGGIGIDALAIAAGAVNLGALWGFATALMKIFGR